MKIVLPVISFVPVEDSYLFSEMTIERGFHFESLGDVPAELLEENSIIWEVPTKRDLARICGLRKGYHRDFVCTGDSVVSIYGMRGKISA